MGEVIIEIEQSKLNIPTLKINNYYIHSKYNPLKEATQFASKNYSEGNLHIIFGNGLGYYTEAFVELSKNKDDILVFEPIENLPSDKADFVFTNMELFKHKLKKKIKQFKELNVIAIPNYLKLAPEVHKDILSFTKDQMVVAKIFENTVTTFSQQWQENYLRNLVYVPLDLSIQNLYKHFEAPVVVVSAGPSLAKQIPLLKKYRDKMVLVAAGSSITALMKYDLEPDFVVTMDGGESNSNHFNSVRLKKANLVYSLVTHHNVRVSVSETESYHYLSSDCYEMESHYFNLFKKEPVKLSGGGSVATYALSFARFISSGPIALVGQDLAYTNAKTHDDNNRNAKGITKEYIEKRGLFKTKDLYDQEIYTDHAFLAMREAFEILSNELEGLNIIFNCTEGGLDIQSIKNITLQNYLEEYTSDIVKYPNVTEKAVSLSSSQLLERLKVETVDYDATIKLLNESIKLLESSQGIRKFKDSVLRKLEANEKKILMYAERMSIGIALKKTMIKVMQAEPINVSDTEYMKYKKIYNKNEMLYKELLEVLQSMQVVLENIVNNR